MGLVKTRTGWAIDYYRNGQRVQEYIGGSKTLAAQALAKVKTEVAQDRFFPDRPIGGNMLISAVLDSYWDNHLQYCKMAAYPFPFNEARRVFGHFTLDSLRKEEIERWMRATVGMPRLSRKKDAQGPAKSASGEVLTKKPATVNRAFQVLSAAINFGIKTDLIRGYKNPCSLVRKLPENNVRDVVLTEGEYNTLCRCLPEYLKPVVAFAYYTGARKTEVLTLQKRDVDFFQNTVYLRDTKNGECRYVPIHPELKETLTRLCGEHPESLYVFNHADGRRVLDVKKGFRSACKRAGLEKLKFHDIRHTALTNWHNEGHSHFLIMQASGHKTLSCFQRYLSFKNHDLQKLVFAKDSDNLETGAQVDFAKAM